MSRLNTAQKAALAACAAAIAALVALAGCTSPAGGPSGSTSGASASESASASSAAGGSSAAASGSASVSAASASAASSAASASAASVASGTLVLFENEKANYAFEIDAAYLAETSGQDTTVYTGGESGQVPYFKLSLVPNSTGRTVDDLLEGTAQEAQSRYQGRLDAEPAFNVVNLSNRDLQGLEYAYSTEDGKDTMRALNYVEEIDGAFYTWSAVFYENDLETAAAMQTAADTFMHPIA